jgi:hypothetical protein
VLYFLSDAQKVARWEALDEMLTIVQSLESDHFDGISAGDLFWFQHVHPSSKIFTRSPAEVIPSVQQQFGAHRPWPRCSSQQGNESLWMFYSKVVILRSHIWSTRDFLFEKGKHKFYSSEARVNCFWVHTDRLICDNRSKVGSNFHQHHLPE